MELTVKQLNAMVEECFRLRKEYLEAKKMVSNMYIKLQDLENDVIENLESMDLKKFASPSGTFIYKYRQSFKIPDVLEEKKKFFKYLEEKGIYDEMISVNSNKLNAWAREEESGSAELDFQIPGLIKNLPVRVASLLTSKK